MCYHIYIIEEESTQKSVQDSVQDNGNSGGVFVGEYKPPFTITNEILSVSYTHLTLPTTSRV